MPPRAIPSALQKAPELSLRQEGIHFSLPFRIMTGYYGGGVEPGKPDDLLPFRAASIRGHLRWWWRATRGGKCDSAAELLKREGEIWGSTERASAITVEVSNAQLSTGMPAKRREAGPAYVLFPAQSGDGQAVHRQGSFDVRFRSSREVADDLDAALRHWAVFGGIGARTRRGLGALFTPEYAGADRLWNEADFLGKASPKPWPTLKGGRIVRGPTMTWDGAWREAIRILQEFRQRRDRPMGHSLWPEADAIRRLRSSRAPNPDDIFPRAAFGLPIIFNSRVGGPSLTLYKSTIKLTSWPVL